MLPLVALVEIFDNGTALVGGILRASGKQVRLFVLINSETFVHADQLLGATLNIRQVVTMLYRPVVLTKRRTVLTMLSASRSVSG